MQYVQRKLQRSVTEMRRSRSAPTESVERSGGLPSTGTRQRTAAGRRSVRPPEAVATRAVRRDRSRRRAAGGTTGSPAGTSCATPPHRTVAGSSADHAPIARRHVSPQRGPQRMATTETRSRIPAPLELGSQRRPTDQRGRHAAARDAADAGRRRVQAIEPPDDDRRRARRTEPPDAPGDSRHADDAARGDADPTADPEAESPTTRMLDDVRRPGRAPRPAAPRSRTSSWPT